jgi:type IV pilus assembly protein PilB
MSHEWFLRRHRRSPTASSSSPAPPAPARPPPSTAALNRLNTVGDKLLTAEEPVEYDIDGIVQVPVNEKVGVTFAGCLRAFLRQDPDIILVGEIRDMETAQIAIQASLTGHLVFSTLHTNDAAGSISRLIDMGVEPFLMASSIESVMATRLVRTICKECKAPYQPTDEVLARIGLTRKEVGDRPFYFGKGCLTCNQTGYKGRRGIYEYLKVTEPIRKLITEKKPTLIIRDRARQLGMRTLREDGIRCMLDGYTTVEEVLKYT